MADGFTLSNEELEKLFHPIVKETPYLPPVTLEGTSYFRYIEGDNWYSNTDMWNKYLNAWGVNISGWKKPGTNSSLPDYQYNPEVVEKKNTYVNKKPNYKSTIENGSWSLKYSDRTYGINKSIGDYSPYNSYYEARSRSSKSGNRNITDWPGASSIGKMTNNSGAISAGILGVSAVDYLMGGKFGIADSFGMTNTFNALWDASGKVYDSVTGLFSDKGAGSSIVDGIKSFTGGSILDNLKGAGIDMGRKRNDVSKFADSISIKGPDDSLITKDAYGLTPQIINNNVTSNAKYDIKSLLSRLGADSNSLSDKLSGVKEGIKGATDRIKDAMKAVNQVSEVIKSVQNKSVAQLLDMASGNFPIAGEIAQGIRYGDSLYKMYQSTDWNDLASVIRAGDRILGTNISKDYIDAQSAISVFSSLVGESMSSGNNGAVDFLIKAVKDNLNSDKANTTNYFDNLSYPISQQYSIAAVQGNLDVMYNTLDFVNASEVVSTSPYIITDLFRSYRLPENCNYEVLKEELRKMKAVCNKLDPNWAWTEIGCADKIEKAYSLKPFTYASSDTKALFSLDPDFLVSMIISNSYLSETMQSVVTKTFISY